MEAINSYDGPGYVGANGAKVQKRDGVKLTHREVMNKFKQIGEEALNAADYERTMHLPASKGRLACDPETGEFDKDAPRPHYNPNTAPHYPRAVHSTITEGEWMRVNNADEQREALATRKWSDTPLERKRRFTLTPEDQLMNLKGQVEAERAGRLDLERRLEVGALGSDGESKENASLMAIQLQQEREAREALEARVNALLAKLEAQEEALTAPKKK